MKYFKLIIITFFLLSTQLLFGQTIPKEVKATFDTKYPDASAVDWSILEDDNGYKVDFVDEEKSKYAVFSLAAEWLETITVLSRLHEKRIYPHQRQVKYPAQIILEKGISAHL